ncbi:unnamed protein product [Mesocestoides corti]|uniref:Ubiquitin-conjugating enzyme E2 Z n=1 Tax=Mesocestoides corti TaxID=53468 RepID=A0A0R3UHA5_MESCO|nr:unnamed protein product [Mesocestoides corti]
MSFGESASVSDWDPTRFQRGGDLSPTALIRIKMDLKKFYLDPPQGICVAPSGDDLGRIFALISGPPDTPYEGGFFLFLIAFPNDYPLSPPRVKILNTDGGTVRFGPNLYANGKVCLSIIGTWSGPQWTPTQNLSTVLVSIQSLMNSEPYYNEPGFENRREPKASATYNEIIKHETLRCAVCDVLERRIAFPDDIFEIVKHNFVEQYEDYVQICKMNSAKNGLRMNDPFGGCRGLFGFTAILNRLQTLKSKLLDKSDNH